MSDAPRKSLQQPVIDSLLDGQELGFFFPEGLLGFASHRRFSLSRFRPADGNPSPFFLLQAKESEISFPIIPPHLLLSEYHISPAPEMLTMLGSGSGVDQVVVMVIVTLRERLEEITVNLQGPLLFNPVSCLGLQLVAENYPVRYPLLKR